MPILERPRLLQQIHAALKTGHLLIQAPAGYGKTILLHHLVRQRPQSVYVACTLSDMDLAHLKTQLQPHLQPQATVILDDIHFVEDVSEVRVWLSTQMRRDDLRFVLSGRRQMDWLLKSTPSRCPLTQMDERELAFTPAESEVLLAQTDPIHAPQVWEAWRQQLQGWPLGLQLLAQVADHPDPLPQAETHLFDYLMSEVFAHLPPALRRFLQVTAVPVQFSDELAEHLLGATHVDALRREAQHRNLFLDEAEKPGWFRYHDLIRDFLLAHSDIDRSHLFQKTSRWFEEQNDLEMAVEHALAGGLETDAARLILAVPPDFVLDESRYGTFRRWILHLSEEVLAAHPKLLIRLGTDLHYTDAWQQEAWPYLEKGYHYARKNGDSTLEQNALVRMASLLFREGRYQEALARTRQVLEAPDVRTMERLYSLRMGSLSLTRMARFSEAQALAKEAVEFALAADNPQQAAFNQTNLATDVLSSLGDFAAAHQQMEAAAPHIGGVAFQVSLWLDWCKIHIDQGNWAGLLARVKAAEEGMTNQEVQEVTQNLERWIYRAAWAIGMGHREEAEEALARAAEIPLDDPLHARYLDWIKAWHHRRQQQLHRAVEWANAQLANSSPDMLNTARLALERDISRGLQWGTKGTATETRRAAAFALHPATRNLVRWRCRADLVRLRALLAIVCWRQNNLRWRRHVRAALYALKTYWGYEALLTRRDPDLGAAFWPLVLILGVDEKRAFAALAQIAQLQPLYELLAHMDAAVRARAAAALAATRREDAMPVVADALAAEKKPKAKAALEKALVTLERQPPPPLTVQMLGGFALVRDGKPIRADAWPRPIVQRLFQYFVLHRGEILSRDRVLDDLWPDTDPDKAWATLRNVYSRLRSVLEPFVQSKGLNRYVILDGGSYNIDPQNVIRIDVEHFEQTVRQTLHSAHSAAVSQLPPSFLAALEGYVPLLPELPYEEWLLETRQRLADLYVDGCLYAAEALLTRNRPAPAEGWARRAIDSAPWLEEAYAVLMRALARQGQRSAALRVYETAVANLRRELDAPPSPQTEWIATRLRQGQEV